MLGVAIDFEIERGYVVKLDSGEMKVYPTSNVRAEGTGGASGAGKAKKGKGKKGRGGRA